MSYQVLARKWRPKTFAQVVGQEHILTALSNGLKENRLHHAYLFSGTRGVGKTSIARLFAKGLNCLQGVTAEPCGECEHCKAIEEGRFIDLIEIDAASRTKVEDTRELLDNVQYKPVQGRYKVYLIDEVHMLSRHSFNALLKTLEEPPEYVKFLLATTDPQKLPITILSRCMQFHLKALEESQIAQHLEKILKAENIPFEAPALEKLAKAAQGSIRDSLSLTDQAIAMSNSNVTLQVVRTMLGLLEDNQAIDILFALQQGEGEKLMAAVQAVAEKGGDWDELLLELTELLHKIALLQLLPNTPNSNEQLAFLAQHITPEDVQFFYQTLVLGRKELNLAPNRRIGAEMALLRALAFHPKFLQADAEANSVSRVTPVEAQSPQLAQSAVSNKADLVEVPVISSTKKTATLTSVATAHQDALGALAQLKRLRTGLSNSNNGLISAEMVPVEPIKQSPQVTSLPVVDTEPKVIAKKPQSKKSEGDIFDRLASIAAKNQLKENVEAENIVENTEENEQEEENLAETYRWEWRDPNLAEAEQTVRPSDIKQAILQEKTAEVVAKVIAIAESRDEWSKIVGSLDLDSLRLVKQLALNSVIESQSEDQLILALRSEQQHLLRESSVQALQSKLSEFYGKSIQLTINIGLDDKPTPLDYRKQAYNELKAQAAVDLQQDQKLQMLTTMFDAVLEMDSIRPV